MYRAYESHQKIAFLTKVDKKINQSLRHIFVEFKTLCIMCLW